MLDDEESLRVIFANALYSSGYKVVSVADPGAVLGIRRLCAKPLSRAELLAEVRRVLDDSAGKAVS